MLVIICVFAIVLGFHKIFIHFVYTNVVANWCLKKQQKANKQTKVINKKRPRRKGIKMIIITKLRLAFYIEVIIENELHLSKELICVICNVMGSRCSSVLRAFAHGAMGHWIDPSWWTQWAISRLSQCSMTAVTKAIICIILSVGWCI